MEAAIAELMKHAESPPPVGLSIELPHEQFANPYISPSVSFNFKDFFMSQNCLFAQIAKHSLFFQAVSVRWTNLGNADTVANRKTCPRTLS